MLSTLLPYALLWLGLVPLAHFMIRAPWQVSTAFWVVVPLVTVPIWFMHQPLSAWSPVDLIKGTVFILSALGISIRPIWQRSSLRLFGWLAILSLVLNVVPGIAIDLSYGTPLNALVGVLVLVGIGGWRSVSYGPVREVEHMNMDLGWAWVVAYTAWVMSVSAMMADGRVLGRQISGLLAALVLLPWWGQERWITLRIYGVGLFFLGVFTLRPLFETWLDTPGGPFPRVALGCSIVGLGGAVLAVRRNWRRWFSAG
ncbi:MAG: hypothetical protein H6739_35545 [Alphaproteobacteria bacterium]|nr:hypothetical protein [Alphaproteobacteria bacterium]